jgi:hypothetical protein
MIPWWVVLDLTPEWSIEERRVRINILLLAGPCGALLVYLSYWCLTIIGVDAGHSSLIAMIITIPPSWWLGRKIHEKAWPTLTKVADQKAERRRSKT